MKIKTVGIDLAKNVNRPWLCHESYVLQEP